MNEHTNPEFKFNCLALLVTEKPDKPFHAFGIARLYNTTFHSTIDHHEFSYLLDNFKARGIVKLDHINSDGMCCYKMS